MSDLPSEAVKISVDYGSPESLKNAFHDQDAIIEAFNPNVAIFQEQIVQAAIDAGVQHLITPDFSSDTFNENVEELLIFEPKLKAQRLLESAAEKHGINWTAIITGPFFDWGWFLTLLSSSPCESALTLIYHSHPTQYFLGEPKFQRGHGLRIRQPASEHVSD
jgi:hypothetical protein